MGYMGSGKSVIGKRLAELKSVKYIDLDHHIESNEKNSISMMFKQRGELYFRKKEQFYFGCFPGEKAMWLNGFGAKTGWSGVDVYLLDCYDY